MGMHAPRRAAPAAREPVVVVGGGWAGLAAAVELTDLGHRVIVLESSRQLGGRARRLAFGSDGVDNGQHLLIGAYHETLRLMDRVGMQEHHACLRLPLRLEVRSGRDTLLLKAPHLPAPVHLAVALLAGRGLRLGERLRALRFALRHYLSGFELPEDASVADLLADQPARLTRLLWNPLCLATLNTVPEQASARVFLRVLRDAFARKRCDSDLLIPRVDLGRSFPEPALDFIERHGGQVRLGARVTALEIRSHRVAGLWLGDERIAASQVILAVPPNIAARLLSAHAGSALLAGTLATFEYEPIATVYLRYPAHVHLPAEMVGLADGMAQWLFDRRVYGQPGLLAAVISGPGEHTDMTREALAARVAGEIAAQFPHFPAPVDQLVVREKRATFRCTVGIDDHRPHARTPLAGCWLAGDYTDTGYPATLEGAVRSGVQCARLVDTQLRQTTP
ncbi:MAG: hydroxysqualene dehydroxylase HpnE [Thiohalomonadaceae bacterium]